MVSTGVWQALTTSHPSVTDITLTECQVSDTIAVSFSYIVGNENFDVNMDALLVTSGNYISSGTTTPGANGIPGLYASGTGMFLSNSEVAPYTLKAADITDGVTTVRMMVKSAGRTIYTRPGGRFMVQNLGPAQA